MEAAVLPDVLGECGFRQLRQPQQLVDPRHRVAGACPDQAADTALGGETGRQPLDRAAQLDRVADVVLGEVLDCEPASRQRLEQSFLLQPGQRHPDRRPRHADALDQRELRDPRPRLEAAAEHQLAQGQLGTDRL